MFDNKLKHTMKTTNKQKRSVYHFLWCVCVVYWSRVSIWISFVKYQFFCRCCCCCCCTIVSLVYVLYFVTLNWYHFPFIHTVHQYQCVSEHIELVCIKSDDDKNIVTISLISNIFFFWYIQTHARFFLSHGAADFSRTEKSTFQTGIVSTISLESAFRMRQAAKETGTRWKKHKKTHEPYRFVFLLSPNRQAFVCCCNDCNEWIKLSEWVCVCIFSKIVCMQYLQWFGFFTARSFASLSESTQFFNDLLLVATLCNILLALRKYSRKLNYTYMKKCCNCSSTIIIIINGTCSCLSTIKTTCLINPDPINE